MIRRLNSLCALLPLTVLMVACTTDSDESVEPVVETSFKARYQPDAALMPFPTDAWRSGSADGTLNIREFENDPLLGQIQQMNLLDGFGLNSAVWADFSAPIDESSAVIGETVFIFDVTGDVPAPVTTFEVGTADFQGGRSVLELNPTAPLDPLHTYAVLLTSGIQSEGGDAASADVGFQAMLDAYPSDTADSGSDAVDALYAQMVKPLLDLATGTGIGASNVVAAWTFTTQSTSDSLEIVQATAAATPLSSGFIPVPADPANPTGPIATAGMLLMPASDLNEDGVPDIGMNADVYVGVIEMPYYSDVENPLTSYWEPVEASCTTAINADLIEEPSASTTAFCPQPEVKATLSVPVLLTAPNAASGCPGIAGVTVFQHGITQDRTNLLPIAGTLASACQAGIAIDLPLHGITDTTSPLYASAANPLYAGLENLEPLNAGITDVVAQLTEQTFDLDVDEVDGIDPSGEYFINLESPITARDALRQSAANLMHLVAALPTMDFNAIVDSGATPDDFAGLPIAFVGHSLGGIAGTTFLGVNTNTSLNAAVLAAPGGDVAELILNSESIYPQVEEGLAENGLTPGMRFFDEFFRNAQTLVEAGDPINYASAANANHSILMMEIVGGAGNMPDQVVPNLATGRLADAMGLEVLAPSATPYADAAGVDGLVQFLAGDHGSLLSPAASPTATEEMQTEMANFIGSGGTALPVGSVDASIINTP